MELVKMDIANFNLTFGKEQMPMLNHFEDFLLPALKMDYVREKQDNSFSFNSIKVIDTDNGFALTGIIIKDTRLEVRSIIDKEGNLVETDREHPSAPYSFFCVFLKNHRMIFVPNQKGSPNLVSFSATVNLFLYEYRRRYNLSREKDGKPTRLPIYQLNIVGIPSKRNIKAAIQKVDKVNKMKLRFYPLNGEDLDLANVALSKIRELSVTRNYVDSNTGGVTFNSPKDLDNVANLMEGLGGTVDSTLFVTLKDGGKGQIKNQQISEKIQVQIPTKHVIDEVAPLIEKAGKLETITTVSSENQKNYKKFLPKIREIFSSFL
ncbi:hypothetical protein I6N95_15310 [Vagococcus sp. BWB3-3]|uniref:Uncharacterized protein n=1 Tax=Vagococcus allomyrinae TaxID=2794353 RepID=A0A940SSV0_9ENTE|nr:hypothetical protein [Vagococcus allomyrinae]MBP1042387.1 hypothetical protein [Vagococcus allomyrinae]